MLKLNPRRGDKPVFQSGLVATKNSYFLLQETIVVPGIKKPKQTPGERNLSILGYLVKEGTWKNRREISTGTPGADLARDRLKIVLESFVEKGLVEVRESENPQAAEEYRIAQKGREIFEKCISFDPNIKFVFGLRRESFESD